MTAIATRPPVPHLRREAAGPPSTAEVLSRLKAAHARMGGAGRFALTHSVGAEVDCYLTHWFRPAPGALEDCRPVASGTLEACLEAAERYAAERAGTAGAAGAAR